MVFKLWIQDFQVNSEWGLTKFSTTSHYAYSVPGEKPSKDPYRLKNSYSTKMEDLEYLPLDICRTYLKVSRLVQLLCHLLLTSLHLCRL